MNISDYELSDDYRDGNIANWDIEDDEVKSQDPKGDEDEINDNISKNIMKNLSSLNLSKDKIHTAYDNDFTFMQNEYKWWLYQFSNLADTSLPNKGADCELDIDIIIPKKCSQAKLENRFSLQLSTLPSLITGVSKDNLCIQLKNRQSCYFDNFSCALEEYQIFKIKL